MYSNLAEIGLEKYLDEYFFNLTWKPESYLEKLDIFIGTLDSTQKERLRRKYSKISNHRSLNDHFHEIMIGFVFHPNGHFPEDNVAGGSPDIIDDNLQIEVKTINAPAEEIERTKRISPDSVSYRPLPDDANFKFRFKKKFDYRVDKARNQISNKGLIYIVWDTTLKGFSDRKSKIETLLSRLTANHQKEYPEITIKCIYFGDLRDMVTTK